MFAYVAHNEHHVGVHRILQHGIATHSHHIHTYMHTYIWTHMHTCMHTYTYIPSKKMGDHRNLLLAHTLSITGYAKPSARSPVICISVYIFHALKIWWNAQISHLIHILWELDTECVVTIGKIIVSLVNVLHGLCTTEQQIYSCFIVLVNSWQLGHNSNVAFTNDITTLQAVWLTPCSVCLKCKIGGWMDGWIKG